jgi:hydroxyethylthiazole kinase-like uncharacterized protein yjeF
MKILSAEQIRRADAYTIAHEPVPSIDLMERAAITFVHWFTGKFPKKQPVKIFCGTGNNGGDGLAIARLLHQHHYTVSVYLLPANQLSPDFKTNEERLQKLPVKLANIFKQDDFPQVSAGDIIIDALFGTGLSRPLEGMTATLIEYLNQSQGTKVAVDIPSGLYADSASNGICFKAQYTFTFEAPKLAFLLPDNEEYVGEWHYASIGLNQQFIEQEPTDYFYTTHADIHLKPRTRYSHKGTYGHALICGGSYGKIGAAILSTQACLRSGAGLVTTCIPTCEYIPMQTAAPEAMALVAGEEHLSGTIETERYNAIGLGPGMGTDKGSAAFLYNIISSYKKPLVLDADALNILSENKDWLKQLPGGSILTPHPGEFKRLFGDSANGFERLQLLKDKNREYNCIIVLKGAHTAVASPKGAIYFNSTGNPGMATGGSGDVLTGIITGLLAQGYSSLHAAVYGVYLHGLAGDIAAEKESMEALVAGDLVRYLGAAFKRTTENH